MTSAEHLSETGLHHHLKQFLGNTETTIVSGEKYISARRGTDRRFPDLLVAFGVDPGGLPGNQRLCHIAAREAARPSA